MPDPTSRLGSLADTAPAVAPRMMSGQFPDEILDPALRELEEKYGVVLDRDALRERLEQGIGFADYGKYARQQFLEGLRLIEKEGLRISTDKGIFLPADLAERVRRRFPSRGRNRKRRAARSAPPRTPRSPASSTTCPARSRPTRRRVRMRPYLHS